MIVETTLNRSRTDTEPRARTLKVLHVIVNLHSGGAERCLFNLATRTDGKAFQHVVISLMGDGVYGQSLRDAGIPVHCLGLDRGQLKVGSLTRLWRLMSAERPDLIQTWMSHSDLVGGVIGRLRGVPVIWNVRHGSLDPELNKKSSIAVVRLCALLSRSVPRSIVFCSRPAADVYAAYGYDFRKITIIPNGVDTQRFQPDAAARIMMRRELGIPEDAPVVGLVARFDPLKDHRTFVRAASLVHASVPKTHFVLAGAGVTWDNAELASWIDAAGMRPCVHLLGQRNDVPQLLASMDVLCSSSISEGFPNVIAEAMACGVRCVATDAGESRSIIGEAGVVVPHGSATDLAAGVIAQLRSGAGTDAAVTLDARTRILEHFSLDGMIRQYTSVYRAAAESASLPDRSAQEPQKST